MFRLVPDHTIAMVTARLDGSVRYGLRYGWARQYGVRQVSSSLKEVALVRRYHTALRTASYYTALLDSVGDVHIALSGLFLLKFYALFALL